VIDTLQKINRFANDFCIPVELIPLDLSIIKTTLRPLGYLFVVQLQCAVEKGWSIKKNPFSFFAPNELDVKEDILNYLCHKL